MDFRRLLRWFFDSFTPKKANAPALTAVREDEPLVRYLIDSKHFHGPKSVVKPDAFLPHGTPATTSCFRTDGLTESENWQLGTSIAEKRDRTLKARADFDAGALRGTPLVLHADNNPPRHANIASWPLEKSDRLQLAIEIAAKSTLRLAP